MRPGNRPKNPKLVAGPLGPASGRINSGIDTAGVVRLPCAPTTKLEVTFPVVPGRAELHVMWRETSQRLTVLHSRVRQGVDVQAASEFCRWLQFSGVVKLLELYPQDGHLRVDGPALRRQITDVIQECGERFNHPKNDPTVTRSELEMISDRLGSIERKLAGGVPELSVVVSEDARMPVPAALAGDLPGVVPHDGNGPRNERACALGARTPYP